MTTLFHVTFASRLPAIIRQGITANPRRRRTWQNRFGDPLGHPSGVYAFQSFDSAVLWSHKQSFDLGTEQTGAAVVIEFVADPAAWRPDVNETVGMMSPGAVMALVDVAPDTIRCIHLPTVEQTRAAIASRNAALEASAS